MTTGIEPVPGFAGSLDLLVWTITFGNGLRFWITDWISYFVALVLISTTEIPAINKRSQLSVRADYDKTFRVRAAQLFNLLPAGLGSITSLDGFKAWLGKFLEQYSDTPPVPGYTPINDNSLLSWRRTHTMCQLSRA